METQSKIPSKNVDFQDRDVQTTMSNHAAPPLSKSLIQQRRCISAVWDMMQECNGGTVILIPLLAKNICGIVMEVGPCTLRTY